MIKFNIEYYDSSNITSRYGDILKNNNCEADIFSHQWNLYKQQK